MRRRRRRSRAILALVCLVVVALAVWRIVGAVVGHDRHGATVEHVELHSRAVGRTQRVSVAVPHGTNGSGRPLLVFLHGRSGDEDSNLTEPMFAALRKLGDRAPVVAFPDGGFDRYWHDRRGGRWGSYVLDEVLPAVQRRFHTDPRRVAIGGISMGGFGAYDLMLRSHRRLCAVGGHSPAIWRTAGETAPGAFDDAQDFGRHDLIQSVRANPGAFARQPLWLDAGDRDPFDPGDRAFVAALRSAGVPIRVSRPPGAHEGSYWARHWKDYLPWYAARLARCRSAGG
jgi:S-formylglutathione hydrolase FrmB